MRLAPHCSPMYVALIACFLAIAAGCAHPHAAHVQFNTGSRAAPGPFSPSVRVDHLLFLAGQIGTDANGALVPGGIRAETRQALENIRAEVERNSSSMERVVKCTVFLADMAEWSTMNEVYVTFFPGPKPARSAFGANGLARNARVEIECIAAV